MVNCSVPSLNKPNNFVKGRSMNLQLTLSRRKVYRDWRVLDVVSCLFVSMSFCSLGESCPYFATIRGKNFKFKNSFSPKSKRCVSVKFVSINVCSIHASNRSGTVYGDISGFLQIDWVKIGENCVSGWIILKVILLELDHVTDLMFQGPIFGAPWPSVFTQ